MSRVRRISIDAWTTHRIQYGNGRPPQIVGVIYYRKPSRLEPVRIAIRDAWGWVLDRLGVPV